MRRTHIVQKRCNMILAIPPPTTLGGSFSPGFYLSGTLNVKFDPCGDDAAVAERVSKTLGSMTFRLHQAQYDNRSKRAYVEFRRSDSDGDQLVVAVFTFDTKERLSTQRIREEVIRKARYVLKGAVLAV